MSHHTSLSTLRALPGGAVVRGFGRLGRRAGLGLATLALAVGLTGCGGGEIPVTLDIGVLVGGNVVSGTVIVPGSRQTLTVPVGQSIQLDANEPVVWSLNVAGTSVNVSGTTVFYAGASVTLTTLSPSRIVLNTGASFPLSVSVPITLVATSTFDYAQVAVVDILLVN